MGPATTKLSLKIHLEVALGLQQLSIPRPAAVPQAAGPEIPWSIPHSVPAPWKLRCQELVSANVCQHGDEGCWCHKRLTHLAMNLWEEVHCSGIRIRICLEPWSFSVSLGHQPHSKQALACAYTGEEGGMEMVNSCLCLYTAAPGINFLLLHFPLQNMGLHFLTLVFDSFWPLTIFGIEFLACSHFAVLWHLLLMGN